MDLGSVLGRVELLDASVVCARFFVLALQPASASPHHNTNFQWLGRVLLFFSNLKHLSSSCHLLRLQFLHHSPPERIPLPPPPPPPPSLLFVQPSTFFTRQALVLVRPSAVLVKARLASTRSLKSSFPETTAVARLSNHPSRLSIVTGVGRPRGPLRPWDMAAPPNCST